MDILSFLIGVIRFAARVMFLLVVAKVILSYFMSPYHPVRLFIDRLVEPLLAPIRRIVPPLQMIDFSPLVLMVIIQVIEVVLIRLIVSLA